MIPPATVIPNWATAVGRLATVRITPVAGSNSSTKLDGAWAAEVDVYPPIM